MSAWTEDELRQIGAAQELEIAPDGRRSATTIWAVRTGNEIYARAAYGPGTGWHRVARASGAGRIQAGGIEKDVTIEDAEEAVYAEVDTAYRDKYGRYSSIVDGIIDDQARATTLRITPR